MSHILFPCHATHCACSYVQVLSVKFVSIAIAALAMVWLVRNHRRYSVVQVQVNVASDHRCWNQSVRRRLWSVPVWFPLHQTSGLPKGVNFYVDYVSFRQPFELLSSDFTLPDNVRCQNYAHKVRRSLTHTPVLLDPLRIAHSAYASSASCQRYLTLA